MNKNIKKIEYGDFQTPKKLAHEICVLLKKNNVNPKSIIEPTCGIGNFFIEALSVFSDVQAGYAFDVNNEYIQILKNLIYQKNVIASCKAEVANFFVKNWKLEINQLPKPILIVGNPPWVTNSQLGQLQSNNLPMKYNKSGIKGFDALTGKSNFDISEWMLNQMIDWIQGEDCTIAMLCKTSVARKVLFNAWKQNKKMSTSTMHIIDSKAYFDISVDSCLLIIKSSEGSSKECKIYDSLFAEDPTQIIGFRDDFLIADIQNYEKAKCLINSKQYYEWRTGIKHDCSNIMELEKIGINTYVNGLGEINELEEVCLFPLLKGSNLANGKIPEKYMLVPQKKIGQETNYLKEFAPKTWCYLMKYRELFDKRRSSIYKGKPNFSIFGVGDYTFKKWKVAIPALYKKLEFSVIGPYQDKAVVFDDTVNFIALENEKESLSLANVLNSQIANDFYNTFIFWDSKRPITVQLLRSLDIDELLIKSGKNEHYSISKVCTQLELA